MEGGRALGLENLLRANRSKDKTCCYKHLLLLLKDSVGMPFATLTHVNFLQCLDCRPPRPLSGDSFSSALLDSFFHEYSAEVASRASKGARSGCSTHDAEYRHTKESDNGDCGDEPIPHHVLLGHGVLSHVPLCDILRARFVSRAWMNSIDTFLQNPRPHMHPYLRRQCLMLLHPASTKTGANASLAVFDFSLNSWLSKPIVFPGNAFFLVGASHGLFCCATGNPEVTYDVDFFVGNPLFGIWTRLPHLPQVERGHYDTLVRMAFVAHVGGQGSPGGLVYNLLRLEYWEDESTCGIKFLMYDSCTLEWKNRVNYWSRRSSWRPDDIVVDDSGLVCWFCKDGNIFWYFDLQTKKPRRGGYAQHEIVHDEHQLVTDGRLGASFGLPSVLGCAGTFFIVYRMLERMQRQGAEGTAVGLIPVVLQFCQIGISRLDELERWIQVSIVPPNLLKQAVEEGSDGTDFVLGTDRTRHIFFILRGSSKMLVYDVLDSIWETLPGCPIGHSFYPYKLRSFFEPLL